MILGEQCLKDFEAHVLERYPEEACGLVVDGAFIPVPNSALEPTKTFRIDPLHYVKASAMGTVQAVLHSHPYQIAEQHKWPPEWPSAADMTGWLANNIPWGICATEGQGISQLVWLDEDNPEPLTGREFIHGINDCYSLIRDWFRLERGIALPNFARGMEWWTSGKDLYDENFERVGFRPIAMEELQVGDCVMFKVRSPVTNHAAVVTGSNQILHHLFHRLSGHDELAKWGRVINRAVRYIGPQ